MLALNYLFVAYYRNPPGNEVSERLRIDRFLVSQDQVRRLAQVLKLLKRIMNTKKKFILIVALAE